MSLRVAIFGQADFGKLCLDGLLERDHKVAGVFAPPEGARPDALASRAGELGLPLVRRRYYQKKSGEPIAQALETYRSLEADVNVMASFTSFLPAAITDAPAHQSLCYHPSLLPRYRGGSALQWQIIMGEEETGVTIFVPDSGVDTGPIAVQKRGVKLEFQDTAGTLFFKKLLPLGVEAMLEAVDRIDAGNATATPQDEAQASFQGLVDDSVAAIDLSLSAAEIDRLVRGCDPQPGAFVQLNGQRLHLYDALLQGKVDAKSGTIVSIDEDGMRIALLGGCLRIARVRGDSGKETAAAFAQRIGLKPGTRLENG